MQVLGTEFWYSARAVHDLNFRAISLAPPVGVLTHQVPTQCLELFTFLPNVFLIELLLEVPSNLGTFCFFPWHSASHSILLVICKLTDVGVIGHCLKEEVNSIHGPIQFQDVVYLKALRA